MMAKSKQRARQPPLTPKRQQQLRQWFSALHNNVFYMQNALESGRSSEIRRRIKRLNVACQLWLGRTNSLLKRSR
jgi:hypothetical protein